jgi:hypothetical protein
VSKYHAVRTNGYASKREAARAAELALLVKAGAISELREQVKFELVPKEGSDRAITYIADFCYVEDGQPVIEDVKGVLTPIYQIKRRLMKQKYGITIKET